LLGCFQFLFSGVDRFLEQKSSLIQHVLLSSRGVLGSINLFLVFCKRVVLVFEVFLIFFFVWIMLCYAGLFCIRIFWLMKNVIILLIWLVFFSDYHWFWILFIVCVCVYVWLLCRKCVYKSEAYLTLQADFVGLS